MSRQWKLGDRVVHSARPEWGVGEVRAAESTVQDGSPCQRVTIRFDRAGVKVLLTAHANLEPAPDTPGPSLPRPEESTTSTGGGWLAAAEAESPDVFLTRIPESATDPFRTPRDRLAATLALYRFTGMGASLLDWAAMQSGLKDPLSKFNRHELEQFFQRFKVNLDTHLKRVFQEVRRQSPEAIAALVAAAPPAAQQVVRRLDIGR